MDITLVKYYSDTCVPCATMKPIIDQLNAEMPDLVVTEVDIMQNPALVQEWAIRAVPTFILIKERVEVSRRSGAASKADMEAWLNEYRTYKEEPREVQPDLFPEQSGDSEGTGSSLPDSSSEQEDVPAGSSEGRDN